MTPIPLLPCPFCGGPPVVSNDTDQYGWTPEFDPHHGEAWCEAHVWCHECGARGEKKGDWFAPGDSMESIMVAACGLWNDRDGRHDYLYTASSEDSLAQWPTRYQVCEPMPQLPDVNGAVT